MFSSKLYTSAEVLLLMLLHYDAGTILTFFLFYQPFDQFLYLKNLNLF